MTVTVVKDIALIIGALVGSYVAISGLVTWRNELVGKSRYELARRLAVGIRRYRDAIKAARNSGMIQDEGPSLSVEQVSTLSREAQDFFQYRGAYLKRWEKINEAGREMYADILEAEAVWGKEIKKDLFDPMLSLVNELASATWLHIESRNPKTDDESTAAISKIQTKRRDVLFDTSHSGTLDEFSKDFEAVVERIDDYLRPHLAERTLDLLPGFSWCKEFIKGMRTKRGS